jgi:hypothetical protein
MVKLPGLLAETRASLLQRRMHMMQMPLHQVVGFASIFLTSLIALSGSMPEGTLAAPPCRQPKVTLIPAGISRGS